MDSKSIKSAIGLISCLVIVGVLSTFVTSSILKTKRDELDLPALDETATTAEPTTQNNLNIDDIPENESSIRGPMVNSVTKESYLSDIKLREAQIEAAWANVTDMSGNSAISAAKYEKGIWEEQLAKIFELYLSKQSPADVEKTRQAQSNFEAERERLSLAAARNANEALDGLAYNKEYVKLTKEKTYEYIESYFGAD